MKSLPKELSYGWRSHRAASLGFSMIELLVSVSILAILAALVSSGVQGATQKAKATQCLTKMRNLGQGILQYTQDNNEYPRSLHSAASAGKQPWAKAILPYMDYTAAPTNPEWATIFEKVYRCPSDKNRNANIYSYALNVHYELTLGGDDYDESPATWRKPVNLNRPSATILLGEPKAVYFADHVMCHQWTSANGAANAIDAKRHAGKANYLFADGHAETLPITSTFDPGKGINLWNPGLAK